MIKSISVHNFKVLHDLNNVNLNKITLIGGKNNAGKSSLLEAIFLHIDRKNPHVFRRMLGWRDFSKVRVAPETMWAPFFYNFSFLNDIAIETIDDTERYSQLQIAYQESYKPKGTLPLNNNINLSLESMSGGAEFHALSLLHKDKNDIDFVGHSLLNNAGMFYEVEIDMLNGTGSLFLLGPRTILNDENVERLGKLDKNDEQDKIISLLRVFEPNLKRFQVIKEGEQDVIYVDFGEKRKMPVNVLGDGFCRCLTIALLLTADNQDIILLDEIDNGIHHSLHELFWNFIIDASIATNRQIIATTHNYEMIDAFSKSAISKDFHDVSYIRLNKKDNEVSAHQFNFDDLSFALSSEMEIR
jgi:AAA15 family ATPase/GTPase